MVLTRKLLGSHGCHQAPVGAHVAGQQCRQGKWGVSGDVRHTGATAPLRVTRRKHTSHHGIPAGGIPLRVGAGGRPVVFCIGEKPRDPAPPTW